MATPGRDDRFAQALARLGLLTCVVVAAMTIVSACGDDDTADSETRTQLLGFFAEDGRLSTDEAECAVDHLTAELGEADLEQLVIVDSFDQASDEQIAVLTEALAICLERASDGE